MGQETLYREKPKPTYPTIKYFLMTAATIAGLKRVQPEVMPISEVELEHLFCGFYDKKFPIRRKYLKCVSKTHDLWIK